MDEFYRVPLTTAEAIAALAALRAVRTVLSPNESSLDPDPALLASASERIREELPEFFQAQVDQLAAYFSDKLTRNSSPTAEGKTAPALLLDRIREKIQDALDRGRLVEIEYYVPSRNVWSVRRVDIEDVYEEEGVWYLEGHCRLRDDHRLFRLDRIRAARVPDADTEGTAPEAVGAESETHDEENKAPLRRRRRTSGE